MAKIWCRFSNLTGSKLLELGAVAELAAAAAKAEEAEAEAEKWFGFLGKAEKAGRELFFPSAAAKPRLKLQFLID